MSGGLRLVAITTASYLAPRLLGEFSRRYPGIEVSLRVTNREQVLASIADNLDDIYILGQPPEDIDVTSTPFMDNPLLVIAAPEHPLARLENIALTRLAEEPWLMREAGSGTRKAIERLFDQHDLVIRPRLEQGSNEAIKQAVLAGLGVSALSSQALALHPPGQFAILDVEHFPIRRHWHAAYPADRELSPTAHAFMAYLLENLDR
ncbi:LysR substrate-binding domain-containing protein [Rhodocyclaceae bacterium SMB388]